jgi:hypothetical protein
MGYQLVPFIDDENCKATQSSQYSQTRRSTLVLKFVLFLA